MSRPTLSFCITTRGPADRARALLELVRPHVDEVVLAVDRNGGEEALEVCADLADRRLTYELERSPAWLIGWILHQCSGDWILRLDDDEVPSAALLEALPDLIVDRYPTVIQIERRWLHETPDRYITTFPWSPDHQPRLLRNVPSLWRFEGRVHMGGRWLGEVRATDLAIYHLQLLGTSIDDRRAKREWYESLVPGLAVEDFPIQDMYVPEEHDSIETAPVPEEDRPLIASMVTPKPVEPAASGPPVEDVGLRDIALYNTDRPVSEGAYEARIEFIRPRSELPPSALRHFELYVENLGDELWHPADGQSPEIHLGWRWRDLRADRHLPEEGRAPFTETVRPGQRTRVPILVRTPAVPGAYALELDVVHEHVRWFGCTVETRVMIESPSWTVVPTPMSRPEVLRGPGPIHYVLRMFPKLSETFVVEELLGLEAAGERVIIDSLEEPLDEPRHPGLAQIKAEVRYVPRHPSAREVRSAHLPLALRRPRTWLRLARHAKATDTWSEFRRAGIVARRTVRERARHVHTHFADYCADVGGMAAALSGRTFTLTAHANDIWQEDRVPHLPRRLAYADGVATSTEYNARHIQALVPDIPVRAVRCAIALADPAPAPPDGPILCVARLVPKKAVDLLIEALPLLSPEHAGLRLEVIGDGPLEDELRALAARLGVADRVDFRGAQPPEMVANAYERCSVFCLPCRVADDGDRDSLRVVLLEALARGLPVVTTDAIEPEVVQDGTTGRVVTGESPQALATAIDELVSDRELAAALGEEGRRRVRAEVTREAATSAMLELFDGG